MMNFFGGKAHLFIVEKSEKKNKGMANECVKDDALTQPNSVTFPDFFRSEDEDSKGRNTGRRRLIA